MGGISIDSGVNPQERGMVSHKGNMVHAKELLSWLEPGDSAVVDRAEDRMVIYGYAMRMNIKIRTQRDGDKYRVWRVEEKK
jgi:hypothetical protein